MTRLGHVAGLEPDHALAFAPPLVPQHPLMAMSGWEPWWDQVVATDDELPPPVLGDYPRGAYWSAQRPPTGPDDELAVYAVTGQVIRLMWDYGVQIPLWDAEGLLPGDPEWLRQALGLSEGLVEDLGRWGRDMNDLDASESPKTKEAYEALDARGRELAKQLHEEVGSRYRIKYRPW